MLNRSPARAVQPTFVEVEVQSLPQLAGLLNVVGIDAILLDNFPVPQLREAVSLRDGLGLRGKVALEASGGITLQTVRSVAATGVERISVGAITHSAVALDLSLDRV
jgi:nicotinate-nucleotide pyrophosphorylase (carboxylating)